MNMTINFYVMLDGNMSVYNKLGNEIKTDNPMYITLQAGDVIIAPEDNTEYVVVKTVKNLYKEELDIYISKIKSKDEIMDEIEDFANKTIKTMLDSIKYTFDFEEDNKDNLN